MGHNSTLGPAHAKPNNTRTGANDFVPKVQTIRATAADLRGPGLPASGPRVHDNAASMARAGGRSHGEITHGSRRAGRAWFHACRDA